MIKGRIGRCLAWLLAGVVLLASCKTGQSDSPQDTSKETSGQTPSGALELIRDGKAGCGIVRQTGIGKDAMTLCSELFDAVQEKTGAEIGFVSDRKSLQDGWVEILIGDTNRPESAQAKQALGDDAYSVSVVNRKLVLVGADERMLEHCLRSFLDMIAQNAEALGMGRGYWTMPQDFSRRFDSPDESYNGHIGRGYPLSTVSTRIPNLCATGGSSSVGNYRFPWVQGGCTDGTYYYAFMITDNSVTPTKCTILKYELASQNLVKVSRELELGHANDAAWNPDRGVIAVCGSGMTHYLIDPETLTVKETVRTDNPGYTVVYDSVQKEYLMATSTAVYVYDSDFRPKRQFAIEGFLSAFDAGGKAAGQGMTCDDTYLYYLEYWQNSANGKDIRCNIAVYRLRTGAFVQRIPLEMKREAENIFIWNNSFYVVCNNISWSGSECFRIDIVPED